MAKVMPYKSISWRWNTPTEAQAEHVKVFYAGEHRGDMHRGPDGMWNGRLACSIKDGDEPTIVVEASTLDGYETIRECGNQLFRKFKQDAYRRGFSWPW